METRPISDWGEPFHPPDLFRASRRDICAGDSILKAFILGRHDDLASSERSAFREIRWFDTFGARFGCGTKTAGYRRPRRRYPQGLAETSELLLDAASL